MCVFVSEWNKYRQWKVRNWPEKERLQPDSKKIANKPIMKGKRIFLLFLYKT